MHSNFEELTTEHKQTCSNNKCCIDSKIAVENGMRFEIFSKDEFKRIRIDNCFIKSLEIEKCDFGFYRKSNEDLYFVELKGKQINKAFDQIISTIKYFENNLIKIPKTKRFGFIVSTKVPRAGTDVKNLIQKFKRDFGQDLKIKNHVLQYNV